jgi:transcriptional regulator with XRE-family HTH domain
MHVSQRFERLLDAHSRPDGSRWTGQQLDEATGGVVTRSYFTNLRKGRIESPGYETMAAIAKAMGFPPEEWFEEGDGTPIGLRDNGRGITDRVEHLFDVVRNPSTGESYTNTEVARMTLGDLNEEDVEGIDARPKPQNSQRLGSAP